MKIHQIIYNSSASTLNGGSGFGVRTASEGIPQEYITAITQTSSLRTYGSGKFNIPSNLIQASPERIYEYPVGYYYRTLQIGEKSVYAIGRVVSVCFDHAFFATGKATRPGNYVAHIFLFDEFPGKKAFNLLEESAKNEDIHFIPRDWTPIQTNQELVELSVGKANGNLPALDVEFPEAPMAWDAKSLDLLFAYRKALKEQKPVVVSLNEAITASTVAKFMNLLPCSLAKESTFVTNHQTEGHLKEAKITFINEYYQYTVYPTLCTHINLLNDSREADKLEEIWRPVLEKALQENDFSRASLLINWIFSKMADDNVESSAELNEALFNYSQNPTRFTINTVDEVNNILELISQYAKQGEVTAEHLNSLVIELVDVASDLNGYAKAIGYCEKMEKAGLDFSAAHNAVKEKMTAYITADSNLLFDAFVLFKDAMLRKYSIVEKYPEFKNVVPEVLAKQTDMQQVIAFAKYFEGDAEARVKNYVKLLEKTPEKVAQYSLLLEADKAQAERIDYIKFYVAHHENGEFAAFFYRQIKKETANGGDIELSKKIHDLTKKNDAFKKLVLGDEQIYSDIYSRTKRQLDKNNYSKVEKIIEEHIISVLPMDSKAGRQWLMLLNVLKLNLNDKSRAQVFYSLAKEIAHVEALKKVAPLCFEFMGNEQIVDFLKLVKNHKLMSDTQILDLAFERGRHKLTYVIEVAKLYEYDYDSIYELISKCKENKKDVKKIIKQEFPKLYSKHRKEAFFATIKSLFNRRKDKTQQ